MSMVELTESDVRALLAVAEKIAAAIKLIEASLAEADDDA